MLKTRAICLRFQNSETGHADSQVWPGATLNEIADKCNTASCMYNPFGYPAEIIR